MRIPIIVHPVTTIVTGVYRGTIQGSRFGGKNITLRFSQYGWVEGFIDGNIPIYGNTYEPNNISLREVSVNDIRMWMAGNISTTSSTTPEGGSFHATPVPGHSIIITGEVFTPGGRVEDFSARLIRPAMLTRE
ncbi:hypothetical protein GCM10009865_41960 [Aeromicrobium ponti]|uniref:Uncharacterized protein n=1 Tax=Cytobacillus oceanisediminis TaxID=665099 RepID=A0A562JIR7_9BACI|nr:hypothetical protein [Cytobacillus oceanisediminis]TWH83040.1 hypothetical protein IQ19_04022 [Cytobacillus oceanisediminis]